MKLQKRVNRQVGDKKYVKWYVDIPSNEIEKLKWMEGQELEINTKGKQAVLKPKKSNN